MKLLKQLCDEKAWHEFFEYKKERSYLFKSDEERLAEFIERKEYSGLAEKVLRDGFCFEIPEKKLVNKMGSNKKRVVYSFKYEESAILKLLSYLLSKYDGYFVPNCYSFRKDFGIKSAIFKLVRTKGINKCYCYKLDIKNYFNSIDVSLLLPKLKKVFHDDLSLYYFFEKMLTRGQCLFECQIISEDKGVMAGTPTSPFLSNVFLTALDKHFFDLGVPYARYSDDIIVFAPTIEELNEHKAFIHGFLVGHNLTVNTDKEQVIPPDLAWSFLGIQYCNGVIDLSGGTLQKIKGKIRRKARSIYRWKNKKQKPNDKALYIMTRRFNVKFFGGDKSKSDLTWSRWFFPLLTTDKGLREVDEYLQMYLRFLVTGKHGKANYKKAPYEYLKQCGYRSLVHVYYKYIKSIALQPD